MIEAVPASSGSVVSSVSQSFTIVYEGNFASQLPQLPTGQFVAQLSNNGLYLAYVVQTAPVDAPIATPEDPVLIPPVADNGGAIAGGIIGGLLLLIIIILILLYFLVYKKRRDEKNKAKDANTQAVDPVAAGQGHYTQITPIEMEEKGKANGKKSKKDEEEAKKDNEDVIDLEEKRAMEAKLKKEKEEKKAQEKKENDEKKALGKKEKEEKKNKEKEEKKVQDAKGKKVREEKKAQEKKEKLGKKNKEKEDKKDVKTDESNENSATPIPANPGYAGLAVESKANSAAAVAATTADAEATRKRALSIVGFDADLREAMLPFEKWLIDYEDIIFGKKVGSGSFGKVRAHFQPHFHYPVAQLVPSGLRW